MTTVRFHYTRPHRTGDLEPAKGRLAFKPTKRRLKNNTVVLPLSFSVALDAEGRADVDLAPTDSRWVWRIGESFERATYRSTHVTVPDVDHIVDFVDLPQVDPKTLEPSEEALAGWDAILGEVRDLHTETRDGARTVREDTTETRQYRDQAQEAADAATSAGYSVTSSPDYSDALRIFYPAALSPRPFVVRLPIGETP